VKFLLAAFLSAALLAAPALAAQPTRMVFDVDDPVLEAELGTLLSTACGTEIVADTSGHVIVMIFSGKRGELRPELDIFGSHFSFTNPDTGATYTIVDVGPDVYAVDRVTGHLTVAVTGRSLTGSGVIGRVVFDLDTGEAVFEAGNPQGDWVANACAALT
jgi:hypothetical protein